MNTAPNGDNPSADVFKNMQNDVRSGLMNCEHGKELEVLHQTLRPIHQVLWSTCMEVKSDIWAAVQRRHRDVRVHEFGSTVMGIAFKDSDFDFYVELAGDSYSSAVKIMSVMGLLTGTGQFTNFQPIYHARPPVLKCLHIRTNCQCDLIFSDGFGLYNSPIVAHLLKFDPRIYELAWIIKYWMKIHDCVGGNRMSNYSVMWMLIFYMQTLPQPIVPPICEFQRNVRPFMVQNYNFAFDWSVSNQTQNESNISQLLLGFFKFYRDFDYSSQVICPLFGEAYSKVGGYSLTFKIFSSMRLNNCLCIQDPFEINRTIPRSIPESEFRKIVWKIGYAAEIIEEELQNGSEKSLFLQIFDVSKFGSYEDKQSVLIAQQQSAKDPQSEGDHID